MMLRRYEQVRPKGTPVEGFGKISVRRSLIGKKIGWNRPGWITPSFGVVEECSGKNILVDDNWEWVPDMLNVTLMEEDDAPR